MRHISLYFGQLKALGRRKGLEHLMENHSEGLMLMALYAIHPPFKFKNKYYRNMLKKAPPSKCFSLS